MTAILFDFDFTLADSTDGVCEAARYALERQGFAGVTREAVRATIGLPLQRKFEMLTGSDSATDAAAFERLFIERADVVMVEGTRLLPGVRELVPRLTGHRLGIVSTKYRRRIAAVLEREGLGGAFDTIVGGEDVTRHKPDPSGIQTALAALGGAPAATLYVGDHPVDGEAARAASVPFVAVLSGTSSRQSLQPYAPVAIVPDVRAVPDVATRHLGPEDS